MIPENWAEKLPPPPHWGKIVWHQIYPFEAILSNFGFCGRKALPPRWGTIFDIRSIFLRHFWATLVFVAETPPPWGWGKFFGYQIYPFEAILSNFGFCGRKAPPGWGNFFDTRSIHLRQFWASLVFVAEKPPPPSMREIFLTPDLSIWGNFENLWFLWQKSPPSSMREIFLTPELSIWGNFEQH